MELMLEQNVTSPGALANLQHSDDVSEVMAEHSAVHP